MHPMLVHFPDREPRIVMHFSDTPPGPGQLLISGWVVERQAAAEEPDGYDVEVWVKLLAA